MGYNIEVGTSTVGMRLAVSVRRVWLREKISQPAPACPAPSSSSCFSLFFLPPLLTAWSFASPSAPALVHTCVHGERVQLTSLAKKEMKNQRFLFVWVWFFPFQGVDSACSAISQALEQHKWQERGRGSLIPQRERAAVPALATARHHTSTLPWQFPLYWHRATWTSYCRYIKGLEKINQQHLRAIRHRT